MKAPAVALEARAEAIVREKLGGEKKSFFRKTIKNSERTRTTRAFLLFLDLLLLFHISLFFFFIYSSGSLLLTLARQRLFVVVGQPNIAVL